MTEAVKLRKKAKRTRRLTKIKRAAFVCVAVAFLVLLSVVFITPTLLTVTNSFMSSSEISANYGQVFDSLNSKTASTSYPR